MSSNELMYMNWQEIIRPERVHVETSTPEYGKFVCEPLERGYGITVGNSLRRIILSSLYGAAIVSVKFDSVMHEFSVIPGVIEDVSEVILNLKEIRLKVAEAEPRTLTVDVTGPANVTAADLRGEGVAVEILNPDQHIATLAEGARLQMTLTVKVGKGYALSEANKDENAPVGTIPIDAVFSPIKRVSYVVGNARVGQKTDYDKLTMEQGNSFNTVFRTGAAFAMGMGVFLSPDSLVLLGRFMGRTGWAGLVLLAGGMLLFFFFAANVREMTAPEPARTSLSDWVVTGIYLLFTTRLFAALFLATGVLVSSGYVFNEVFLYWFPNFGFAFLLLFLILAVQLTGRRMPLIGQMVFAGLAISGLLVIILKGITAPAAGQVSLPVTFPKWPMMFLPLLLWVGFELGLYTGIPARRKSGPGISVLIITCGGILFLCLGLVYISHIPLEKLAATTIPHIKTARILMGDPGRAIMGIVVISGSLAAVNALFSAGRIQAEQMVRGGLLPKWTGKPFVIPALLTVAVSGLMAGGMAGSPKLEIWIRSVFILWVWAYGLNLVVSMQGNLSFGRLLITAFTLSGGIALLMIGENRMQQLTYFILLLSAGLLPGVLYRKLTRNIS